MLDELRTHSELDAEDLSVYRDGSLSYNNAEATIEAILISSLQSFIYHHLDEWVDERYDTTEEAEVAA